MQLSNHKLKSSTDSALSGDINIFTYEYFFLLCCLLSLLAVPVLAWLLPFFGGGRLFIINLLNTHS